MWATSLPSPISDSPMYSDMGELLSGARTFVEATHGTIGTAGAKFNKFPPNSAPLAASRRAPAGPRSRKRLLLPLGREQAQPDGQRLAEHLVLLLALQFRHLLDHAHPVPRHRLAAQHGQHAVA